jgi:hypothetical protein
MSCSLDLTLHAGRQTHNQQLIEKLTFQNKTCLVLDQVSISYFTRRSGLTKLLHVQIDTFFAWCCLQELQQEKKRYGGVGSAGRNGGAAGATEENLGGSLRRVSLVECCRYVWTVGKEECK